MIPALVPSTALAGVQFNESNKMKSYHMDGQQQAFLGTCLAQRCNTMSSQWKLLGYRGTGALGNIASTAAVFRMLCPMIKGISVILKKKDAKKWTKFSDKTISRCMYFERNFDQKIQKYSPYFEAACVVSYVAMIVFGHTVVGMIGLAVTLLSKVKQKGYLPGFIEAPLQPMIILATMYASMIAPVFIVFRILGAAFSLSEFLSYLLNHPIASKCLPNFLKVGSPGKHVLNPSKSLREEVLKSPLGFQEIERAITNEMKINKTSMHNKNVEKVLPDHLSKELEKLSFKDLYKELEKKISSNQKLKEGFEGTSTESLDGWKTLKSSVTNDTCPDARPVNFKMVKTVIKAALHKANKESDPEIFAQQVAGLDHVGKSCNEGWLREISFMAQPEGGDLEWQVHHQHAKFRSYLIRDTVRKMDSMAQEAKKVVKDKDIQELLKAFELVGGSNNVHLLNQTQAALWHRWRSFEAEAYFKVSGRSPFMRLLHSKTKNDNFDSQVLTFKGQVRKGSATNDIAKGLMSFQNVREFALAQSNIVLPLPIPGGAVAFTTAVDELAKKEYTPEDLINYFYEKIKPQYLKADEGLGLHRDISWGSVLKWMQKMDARAGETGGFSPLDAMSGYNPLIVDEKYDTGCVSSSGEKVKAPILTKEGVKLMLWDMGILEKE